MSQMDATELDVLTEFGTIGAGNATTALSVLLNSKLTMKMPKVSFMNLDEFVESIGGAENVIAGVMSNISGEIEGFVLFALAIEDAHRLVNRLMGLELSSIASLETLTGIRMRPSNPMLAIDMAGAILSFPAVVNSRERDEVLRIESQFEGEDLSIEGHIMMIADSESYNTIRKKLGI